MRLTSAASILTIARVLLVRWPAALGLLLALVALGCHGRGVRKKASACPMQRMACPGSDGNAICTDVQSDAAHCGGCDVACAQGQMCVQGQCRDYCPAPFQSCADRAGKALCRDVRNDVDNCGACGTVCPGGQLCAHGRCNLHCAPPQTLCPSSASPAGGICANLQSDNLHCGSCDLICPGNLVCVQGRCGPCSHTSIPGAVMLLDFAAKPTSLEIADLDSDGVLDLVALSASENTVTLGLGHGDGSFADRQAITTGKAPKALAVGDLDGDGLLDLAVANSDGRDVVVLQGIRKTRSWRESRHLTLPSTPTALAAADLDLDGRADLAVATLGSSSGELLLLLSGQGETTATALRLPLQGTPNAVLLTDLNKDGRPDIVVSLQEGTVAVALTGADGEPGPLRRFVSGPGCNAVLAVDLNDDSRPDLVTSSNGDNSLRVLLGQGDGSFAQAIRYDMGVAPAGLATADLDGDGKLDVLTGAPTLHGVRVLPGRGDGTLGTAKLILAGSSPVEVRVADLNRDGKPDLVAAHSNDKSRALSVILARDTGVYAPPTQALSDEPDAMRVVDLNGDGNEDLVIVGSKLQVLRGHGDGSFAPATVYGPVGATDLLIEDANQDRKPDVAVATYKGLMLFLNDGTGRLTGPTTISGTPNIYSLAGGDIDHDGRLDFALGHPNGIEFLIATASGEYQSKNLIYSSCGCDRRASMRLVDLDGNGHLDLLTLSGSNYYGLDVWTGDGTGEFTRLGISTDMSVAGQSPRMLGMVQAKDQGPPGVVLVARGGYDSMTLKLGSIASYPGVGDGSLSLQSRRELDALAGDGALLDLDQDGVIDAVVPLTKPMGSVGLDGKQRVRPEYAQYTDNAVALLRGLRDGALDPWLAYWLDSPASAVGAADFNNDGSMDIVAAHDVTSSLTILLTQATPCR